VGKRISVYLAINYPTPSFRESCLSQERVAGNPYHRKPEIIWTARTWLFFFEQRVISVDPIRIFSLAGAIVCLYSGSLAIWEQAVFRGGAPVAVLWSGLDAETCLV